MGCRVYLVPGSFRGGGCRISYWNTVLLSCYDIVLSHRSHLTVPLSKFMLNIFLYSILKFCSHNNHHIHVTHRTSTSLELFNKVPFKIVGLLFNVLKLRIFRQTMISPHLRCYSSSGKFPGFVHILIF